MVRAEENVLQQLAESWNALAIQTNWKLEPLLTFADEQLEIHYQLPTNSSTTDEEAQLTLTSQGDTHTNESSSTITGQGICTS